MNIEKMFREKFIDNLYYTKDVGVEIEMPLINLNNDHIIDMDNIQKLFDELLKKDFEAYGYDNKGKIIALKNIKSGDTISLEYSCNTLEFSLSKERNILELKNKFSQYYNFIQSFLRQFNYELCGNGINPYYKEINKKVLEHDRYKAIERLLVNKVDNVLYGQFCAYCCSIQTHINVSRNNLVKTFNAFSYINTIKEKLFANSYMEETKLKNSRKYLWNISNFKPFNVGKTKQYNNFEEIVEDYLNRTLFFIERDEKYLMLKNACSLKEYFNTDEIIAVDEFGYEVVIKPERHDFECFRSYKELELTKYGTVEIRTDCTQKVEDIFKVVALNVGIYENLDMANEMIKNNKLSKDNLITVAKQGLEMRNMSEEKILIEGELSK